ncbi:MULTISPECIES: LolA family protein [unclassified Capnocytophaga]|uniref:LolA family protein n=1 Tax=unclassified Capnocytophaga TaxID=2640652 RepID=UPI00058F2C63|nr:MULTISPECIES: outer membrane lipoprotein carrier protein LolA [unclassified Capnocytophaga]MEB3004736.1 outer membrane lipoprotein carrier protein LolA [Capnocytophaga sp. G2]
MKKCFILFFVLVTSFSQAQNANRAKALLDEVYKKVSSYKNIYIDFRYSFENSKEHIKQDTRGNVTLSGEKYLLNYMGVTKLFDGKKIYTIIPENEEVTIETANNKDEQMIMPSQMLTFYKKDFSYKWDIVQQVKGRKIQYIELKPIKQSSDIKLILLGIDTTTKHIYNLIQVGKNEAKTTITINEFKTNQPLSGNEFVFNEDKYKKQGYYINK